MLNTEILIEERHDFAVCSRKAVWEEEQLVLVIGTIFHNNSIVRRNVDASVVIELGPDPAPIVKPKFLYKGDKGASFGFRKSG